jgi:AraC-like DNA-binding protein
VARCTLDALTDREVDVAALGIAPGLVARVVDAATVADRIAVLVGWLRAHLAEAPGPDRRIAHAVTQLCGGGRVDDVARALGVSRQYLARAFRREVGISPKALARIARMQRAAAAIGRGEASLARIAAELGYFDQAHLANEVRALSGVSPGVLAVGPSIALAHLYDR